MAAAEIITALGALGILFEGVAVVLKVFHGYPARCRERAANARKADARARQEEAIARLLEARVAEEYPMIPRRRPVDELNGFGQGQGQACGLAAAYEHGRAGLPGGDLGRAALMEHHRTARRLDVIAGMDGARAIAGDEHHGDGLPIGRDAHELPRHALS
ncbi:MAG: hypothetical protein FWC46_06255 [Actinomycetia bacterium]|nr:hypothetical protein [Actinomycetes bacterium]